MKALGLGTWVLECQGEREGRPQRNPMHPSLIQLIASELEREVNAEGAPAVAKKYGVAADTLYRVIAKATSTKPATYAMLALRMGLLQPSQALALSSLPPPSDAA